MRRLRWEKFFIKDHVKSLKTSVGSIIEDPAQIDETLKSDMWKYRGFIEGGLCIRRIEDFIADSERRYFVLNRKPYAAEPGAAVPEPVADSAQRRLLARSSVWTWLAERTALSALSR